MQINTGAKIIEFDISDHDNIAENAAKCLDILDGRVDVLVNNAGTGVRKSLDELNIDDFLKDFNVNVFGLALFTKEITPLWLKNLLELLLIWDLQQVWKDKKW